MSDDRSSRIAERRQQRRERVEAEESEPSKTEQTDETGQSEQTSVKSKPSVLMYLDPELKTDLDIRFDEVNLERKRAGEEPIEKNRDFYPTLIRKALLEISAEDFE